MRVRYIVALTMILLVLTACSTEEELATASAVEEPEESEPEVTEEAVQEPEDNQHVLEVPDEIMEDWPEMTQSEKEQVVKESLDYHVETGKEEQSPVIIELSIEAYIEVIDARYIEIDTSTDEPVRFRMMDSPISVQVGVMGHPNNLIKFWYE